MDNGYRQICLASGNMGWYCCLMSALRSTFNLTTVLITLITCLLIFVTTRRRRDVPPGPKPWPIVGNIPSLVTKDILGKFHQLRLRYGDIYGLYIGSELSIFLNGHEVIHDAFVKKGSVFAVRSISKYEKMIMAPNGIVFANGSIWKKRRALCLKAINDICLKQQGKLLEEMINKELGYLVDKLASADFINPNEHMDASFANVTFTIMHGRRIGYDNKYLNWYMTHLKEQLENFAKSQVLLSCFSFLDGFPFDPLGIKKMDNTRLVVQEYHRKMCDTNFENYKEGSRDCLVDCYLTDLLNESKETVGETEEKIGYRDYFDDNLWNLLYDIIAAGTETCATTLNWIILHLAIDHDVQEKLHEEIDRVLSHKSPASLADKDKLPYVQATVLEGIRMSVVTPIGLPHGVSEDFLFRGFLIPKGAQVYAVLPSVLKDPAVFPDPEIFKPERFLSEDGTSVIVPKEFISFVPGARSCIGETMARHELFLYVATLVQKFDLIIDPDTRPASLIGELGITHQPPSFKVQFKSRK